MVFVFWKIVIDIKERVVVYFIGKKWKGNKRQGGESECQLVRKEVIESQKITAGG